MDETGSANCGWLKRLKNSARKLRPMRSHGSANCLMREKSVFTKSGPESGVRDAFPSSPLAAAAKAQGLNQSLVLCTLAGALQRGLAATAPALFGLPTSSGRFRLFPLFSKLTPDWLKLFTTNTGNPEVILT